RRVWCLHSAVRIQSRGAEDKGRTAMDRDPATPPAIPSTSSQRLARIALATAVVAVGLWILREFLAALAWAAVLAIAFWPLYRRLPRLLSANLDRVLAPLLAT